MYSSEKDYKETEIVDESKSKLEVVEPDPESLVLVELDIFEELRPEVIAEL